MSYHVMKNYFTVTAKSWYWICCLLTVFAVSCKDQVQEVMPIDERARIVKLLKDRGFVQMPTQNLRVPVPDAAGLTNIEDLSFDTYSEAESYVNALDALNGTTKSVDIYDYMSRSSSKSQSSAITGPCGQDGTYYIDAATSGLFSDVNIIFQRTGGAISSVTTNVSGTALYTWTQQAYTVFSPYNFCIDANVQFGIQIGSLPTNWAKRCVLRTYLDTDACKSQIVFKWGKCNDPI